MDVGGQTVAVIMFRERNLATFDDATEVFGELDRSVFPPDGRFMEVFQLWVHPDHRRKGLATALKLEVESEARERHIGLVYTHTDAANSATLRLNESLGYREVRRGPIWDEVVRVSLVKQLL
jgi:ribosomal protein S18 acetylase RimI-like enzyme